MSNYEATKKQRMKMLDINIDNQRRLSGKMKDVDNGVIPQKIDTRSTQEKLEDGNYLYHEVRDKVYKLFNNDTQYAEEFLDRLQENAVEYLPFNAVYSQLLKQFKNTLSTPDLVYTVMEKLIDNLNETGVPTTSNTHNENKSITYLNEIKGLLEDSYDRGEINKKKGDDMTDKLNALTYIFSSGGEMLDEFNNFGGKKNFGQRKEIKAATADLIDILLSHDSEQVKINQFAQVLSKLKQETFNILSELRETKTKRETKQTNKNDKLAELHEMFENLTKTYEELVTQRNALPSKKTKEAKDLAKEIKKTEQMIDEISDEIKYF